MFRLLDTDESAQADAQDLRESTRLDAQRTDHYDPAVEAELRPLWRVEDSYVRPSDDPYEAAMERYRGLEV